MAKTKKTAKTRLTIDNNGKLQTKKKVGRPSKISKLMQDYADQILALHQQIETLQTKIDDLTKPTPPSVPTLRSTIINKTGRGKKGVAIMTEAASEIVDDARKGHRGPNPAHAKHIAKARPHE